MKNYRVWHLMADVLTPAVIEELKRSPPEYIVGDDLSWLDEIVEKVSGYVIDTQDMLAYRTSTHYHDNFGVATEEINYGKERGSKT